MTDDPRLDPDAHAAFLLVALANKVSASASRVYMRSFGIGVMEWRVMAMAAAQPGVTANRVGTMSGVDKSSVSRATHSLIRRGLLTAQEDPADNRRTLLTLTAAGQALHDKVIQASLEREERLLHGLDKGDRARLFDLLKRMTANMSLLDAHRPGGGEAKRVEGKGRPE